MVLGVHVWLLRSWSLIMCSTVLAACWSQSCGEDGEGHWVNMQWPHCPIVHVHWVTRHSLKGPASVVNQCPWAAQQQTDKEQALTFYLTVSHLCHIRHRCHTVVNTGNQFWATVWPSQSYSGRDFSAVGFKHNFGISAGVFEVTCMQGPSHSASRSGRLLGWALAWLPV